MNLKNAGNVVVLYCSAFAAMRHVADLVSLRAQSKGSAIHLLCLHRRPRQEFPARRTRPLRGCLLRLREPNRTSQNFPTT